MFNKFYQEELAYLREMGAEFAKAHPDAAHFLGEAGADPDVERLLEGFAFLTARLRQKLDDDFPEILHDLVEIFWPHYLRPIPSMAVVRFEALPSAAKERRDVPPGAERRQFADGRDGARPEVKELAEAVDQYKLRHRRRFITFDELYDVMASLGYRKV